MLYTIYRIDCLIENKPYYYIGKHQTTNVDDNYMGSGVLLKKYYQKYGYDNFKKTILYIFDNESEMNAKEIELIGDSFRTDKYCLNLVAGGEGGNLGVEINKKIGEKMKGKPSWNKGTHNSGMKGHNHSIETIEKIKLAKKGQPSPMKGRHLSEETKQKMSESHKKRKK